MYAIAHLQYININYWRYEFQKIYKVVILAQYYFLEHMCNGLKELQPCSRITDFMTLSIVVHVCTDVQCISKVNTTIVPSL